MAVSLYTQTNEGGKPWRLPLSDDGDGSITVNASNTDGEEYSLITFNQDGTFIRHAYVEAETGFKVDKTGKIVESK